MRVALLNASEAPDASVARIAEALSAYGGHLAQAWDRTTPIVEFFAGLKVAPDGYIPLVVMDDADTPGCLGYHDADPKGRAYGRAFLHMIPNRTVLRDPSNGGESLAACLTHEFAEIFGDEYANLYADGPLYDPQTQRAHSMVAVELGDPVQAQAYPITVGTTEVDASNFVFPAWFSARCIGRKVDYLSALSMPLAIAPGGYAIVRDAKADGEVFARFFGRKKTPTVTKIEHANVPPAAWRMRSKNAPGGRTKRRLEAE